jgi:hypothetical protein
VKTELEGPAWKKEATKEIIFRSGIDKTGPASVGAERGPVLCETRECCAQGAGPWDCSGHAFEYKVPLGTMDIAQSWPFVVFKQIMIPHLPNNLVFFLFPKPVPSQTF